jgi:putative transcriptional regulator
VLVFSGGPVEPYRAFTLHSRDVMPEHSVPVDDDTAFNVEDDVLKALADHAAPKSMIFALGYSGWASGQLENELDRGDWYVVASDPALVFGTEPARIWERAVALFSTEL